MSLTAEYETEEALRAGRGGIEATRTRSHEPSRGAGSLPLDLPVSKLTRSITFSYFDSATGLGIPRYPDALSVDGGRSLHL